MNAPENREGRSRRRHAIALAVILAIVYVWLYLDHPGRPHGDPDELSGWWRWFDQIRYRNSAEALAALRFDPDAHHYPYGYALLGAPFVTFAPNHPFLIPNLLSFVGAGVLLFFIASRWLGPRESMALVLGIGVLAHHELTLSLLPPWSTIPTHALTYAMIHLSLAAPASTRKVLTLAALDGGVFLCRPFDAVLLSPILVGAVLELRGIRSQARAAVAGMTLLGVFPLLHFGLNLLTFGETTSPYERFMAAHIGFFDHSLFFKAYVTYLDGNPVYRFHEPVLIERLPWLLACLPGAAWVFRREGIRVAGPIVAAMCSIIAYTGYNNMSPDSFYRFSLVHYTAWTLPLAGVCTWLSFRRAWRTFPRPIVVASLAFPVALAWFVRVEETSSMDARVDARGRVRLPRDPDHDGYDVMIVRGIPFDGVPPIHLRGEKLGSPRQYHMRRQLKRLTLLDGYAIVFAQPLNPDALGLRGREIRGQKVEFRRLRTRFTWVPPMVHKQLTGRGWGVDALRASLRSPAARFATDVGRVHHDDGTVHTTGTAGVLQTGPGVPLRRGAYVVVWHGTVATGGKVQATVLVDGEPEPVAAAELEISPTHRVRPIARLRFRLHQNAEAVDVQLSVPESADLVLHALEIVPR